LDKDLLFEPRAAVIKHGAGYFYSTPGNRCGEEGGRVSWKDGAQVSLPVTYTREATGTFVYL
jgi:hypothetical protein